jgi:hypothetical protein
MEIIFFVLLVVFAIISPFVVAFVRNNPQIVQRTKKILHANRQPPSDPKEETRALETAIKNLRALKQNEHDRLIREWQQTYLTALPPTDPERVALEVKRNGINVQESRFVVSDPHEEVTYAHRVIKGLAAIRAEPTQSSKVLGQLAGGTIIKVDGYTYGERIGSTDIWYRIDDRDGVYATAYIWAGATTQPEPKALARVFPDNDPKSPAAERDLARELERLNRQVDKIPKTLIKPPLQVSLKEVEVMKKTKRDYYHNSSKSSIRDVAVALTERKNCLTAPRETRYDPVPKNEIPSTLRKVYH